MNAPYVLRVASPEGDSTMTAQSGPEARVLGARILRDVSLTEPLEIRVTAEEQFRREPDGGLREALFAIYKR